LRRRAAISQISNIQSRGHEYPHFSGFPNWPLPQNEQATRSVEVELTTAFSGVVSRLGAAVRRPKPTPVTNLQLCYPKTLWAYLNRRSLTTTIRQLVRRHANSPPDQPIDIVPTIIRGLSTCDLADLAVAVVDVPGRAVVVTRAFYDEFRRRTDAAR